MTVPEPTPDHASRGSLFRRVGFLATAVGLTGAFAFSLSGIASTRGAVSPETQAAVVAAQQRSDASETAPGRSAAATAATAIAPAAAPPAAAESEAASHEALSRLPGSLSILRGQ